jgi:hypothetical protein
MNKIFAISLLIILIIISQSGCIFEKDKEESHPYFSFLIELTTTDQSFFEVTVPILINVNDANISLIMNGISLEGNGYYNYNDTKYGKALTITGQGKIVISNEGKEKMPFAWLNLLFDANDNNDTADERNDISYWVFANLTNANIIHLRESSGIHHGKNENKMYISSLEGYLNKGWQKVQGNKIIKVK